MLQIYFDRSAVKSPDSLTGTLVVRDPDGLDSIWLTIESSRTGEDGLLNDAFSSHFRYSVPAGLQAGTLLPVRLEARDLAGFLSTLDTNAVIIN